MQELRKFFKEYKEIQAAYAMAISTLYYDIHTIAPKKGMAKRNQAMAFLSGEAFSKATDPSSLNKIEELGRLSDDPEEKREIELFMKEMKLDRVLPKNVYWHEYRSI